MSKFLTLVLGAAKSNTVQFNGILLAIWTALMGTDLIQQNPDVAQIMLGVQAIVNIVLRFKTDRPLSER